MVIPACNRLLSALGFDPQNKESLTCFAPAAFLSVAFAALPWLLLLPLDTDRSIPLAFLPAVWLGWKASRPAARLDAILFGWAVVALLVSAACSAHAARAFAMTSSVGWTLAGALVARNLAVSLPAVRLALSGLAAGAVAGTVMIRFGVDASTATFPIYGSPRLFGAHQFAGCVAALGLLILSPTSRSWRILAATAATTIVLSGMLWSGSRAPVVGLAVMLAAWLIRGSKQELTALLCRVPPVIAAALLISWLFGHPYPSMGWTAAFERTVQATGIEQVSSARSIFWSETWDYALRSPWIGHGADGYRFIQPTQNGSQPHNMVLQWLLEYGIFGFLPLAGLLLRGVVGLLPLRAGSAIDGFPLRTWAAASLLGAACYGLLEGVFYHATIFMPVAAIAGFAVGMNPPGTARTFTPARAHAVLRPLLLAALLVLLLHGWLGLMLLKARNITPDSLPARVLRAFPSTTHGLPKWTESWRQTDPQAELEWVKWAQSVSVEGPTYHVYAAQLHIWRKDYKTAEAELLDCLAKVHRVEREHVQTAIDTVRALDAGKPIPQSSPQP